MRARRAPAPILLLAGLLLAACGHTATIDSAQAQTELASALRGVLQQPVTAVRCPSRIVARKGASFRCTAGVDGARIVVRATPTGQGGHLRAEPLQAVLHTDDVAADASTRLSLTLGRAVSVTCGPSATKVLFVGQSITCTGDDGISTRPVTVVLRDWSGNLTYRVDTPATAPPATTH